MKKLSVHSVVSNRNYSVLFVKDIKKEIEKIARERPTHCLMDRQIFKIYKNILDRKDFKSLKLIKVDEDQKTLEKINEYISFLLKNNIHKDHAILVIGGGLVQDIGSFTSHIILRGIDWIFIPTTLLAISDSCIGSKSGINIDKYKNQVGSFHPPTKIIMSTAFLDSLPKTGVIDGIGEILKHALIKGGKRYQFISENISKFGVDKRVDERIIYESLLIKKEVVEKDELEKNIRRLLNYGHTFGHALEGYTDHKISHGIGVLTGMDLANYISLREKIMSRSNFNKIHNLIYSFIKSRMVKIIDFDKYMIFLSRDKKVVGDRVNVLLAKGPGEVKIMKFKLDIKLKNYIKEYFDKYA